MFNPVNFLTKVLVGASIFIAIIWLYTWAFQLIDSSSNTMVFLGFLILCGIVACVFGMGCKIFLYLYAKYLELSK